MTTSETVVYRDLNVTGPLDGLITQAIEETKPHWVIETGNKSPVSTLYHGYLLSKLGEEAHTLVSVTRNLSEMPRRRNIYYLDEGLHPDLASHLSRLILPWERVMVILNRAEGRNPLALIQTYAPLVTEGCYLVMDETIEAFALKNVAFEPDWTLHRRRLFLRERHRDWSLSPFSSLNLDAALRA